MPYDLVIRNGTVVDGSGLAPYRADVAVVGDRIARIGRLDGPGREEIDAEGHVVTPGFVDGHTHMDAQVFWDEIGSCSCWHGVTSVVMGNCGFTLAPAKPDAKELVIANLERAEDIPGEVMQAGIDWSWETFPEYLDAVEGTPKAINYACQVGHSALRTWAMGERAFTEEANDDDLVTMDRALREALVAGAVGFTTSRSTSHRTADDRPVASRLASWEEVCRLVGILGEFGTGVFELATETASTEFGDAKAARESYARLVELAISSRVPTTFGMRPKHIPMQLAMYDEVAAAGGRMFGMTRSEAFGHILSFKSRMPFDGIERWTDLRRRFLAEQRALLSDPETRAALVEAARRAYNAPAGSDPTTSQLAPLEQILVMKHAVEENPTVTEVAAQRGIDPIELMIDLSLDSDFEQVFMRVTGWNDEELLEAMSHPRTIMTFSDQGAHVGQSPGARIQTRLLSHWVRDRQDFSLEEAVRMLTLAPALAWSIPDRGLLREGMIADLNVFDPATVAPGIPTVENDLPSGATRVVHKATGFLATIVAGREILHENKETGALPGRLLRGPLAG